MNIDTAHIKCHGFWYPVDARNPGINTCGIDLVFQDYSGFNNREIMIEGDYGYGPIHIECP